jgi:hypothetical protein
MTDEILNSSMTEALLEKWRRRKWILMGSFILLFSAMLGIVLVLHPLYTPSTSMFSFESRLNHSIGSAIPWKICAIQSAIV